MLLRANLKQLRLPTMQAEFEKLAREAAARTRLTRVPAAADGTGGGGPQQRRAARIRAAGFPVAKDFDTFDFSAVPPVSKPKVLELARGEWIEQQINCAWSAAPGRAKRTWPRPWAGRVPAGQTGAVLHGGDLVTQLEEAQKQYQLERLLSQLDRTDLLICDELGYLSFSRSGAELLFQVFAERYERRSLLVTSNLAFSEWGQVFQGERMTAALLDRLTHRCHIFEMNGESYRFRESMKRKKDKDPKKGK